jgi:hypothetical protein
MEKKWPKSVEDIAYELQGSCQSLEALLEFHEMEGAENDAAFCNALDQLVFQCEGCGWWCEISEMTDDEENDWNCTDCVDS